MASTRCHAQSHLRFHPVVLPSQVSLPQLISGIAGSGILLQALSSPSLGPINWHVHLVLHHHLYVILANMLRFTSSRLIIPLMSLPPLLNSCIRMCGDLQSRLLVVLSTMLASWMIFAGLPRSTFLSANLTWRKLFIHFNSMSSCFLTLKFVPSSLTGAASIVASLGSSPVREFSTVSLAHTHPNRMASLSVNTSILLRLVSPF
jgi:hypothetical protein